MRARKACSRMTPATRGPACFAYRSTTVVPLVQSQERNLAQSRLTQWAGLTGAEGICDGAGFPIIADCRSALSVTADCSRRAMAMGRHGMGAQFIRWQRWYWRLHARRCTDWRGTRLAVV